ncbi:HAD family hydrolase [Pseudoalteromonas ulvae]|uniref:HAD family hydrolase n=1 Tax=Pseudoalteromonas ulvae TaxID=107327 RepID=A0A244CT78_PSEDV|nr:HAD-IA family hydrolase [Pseudoalteromonas ulvae]OUL58832.1 HAD family hydrolase [Pseudoalteromonas ulvae]
MRYKLVIFDWDGTLMDSEPRIVSAMHNAAVSCQLAPVSAQSVKSIIGMSLPQAVDTLYPSHSMLHAQLIDAYKHHYQSSTIATPLFDGAKTVMQSLKRRGYKIAIATGKGRPGLDRLLSETGLDQYVDLSRSSDETDSKPSPDMLNQLLNEANVCVSQAVMVGDTTIDLKMAQAINMDRIGVSFGVCRAQELLPYHPIVVIDELQQLLEYV